uniref:peptidyl-tRNA hydrolase n=1 Tax=Ananas comosus var. bracteatus TaxID=296719 RepID=A0A6V7QBQ5_ANACO|nr:unnamed protein product [Ananas comosus var. bracteatus]
MLSLFPVRFTAPPLSPISKIALLLLPSICHPRVGARVRVPTLRFNAMSGPSAASAAPAPGTEDAGEPTAPPLNGDVVVQYVVLRRDLIGAWPLGSVVAQGCHAAVAAVWAHRDHPDTLAYCSPSNLDSMHKVTLEVKGEAQLRSLAEKLEVSGVEHKLWIEQPENIPTCLATRPCPKSQVAQFFRKLKLCK